MNTRLSVLCRKVFHKKDIWSIFFCGMDRSVFSSVQEFYPGNVCCFQEQRKVPPSNFESFSIFSIVIMDLGLFRFFAFGFPGMCWCRSTASQLEPLFPHLFSLSPLMISSDRHDSWINMQTQLGLPPPQNLYYALRFRDEQNMEITMGFYGDLDEWMMRRGDFFFYHLLINCGYQLGKSKQFLAICLKSSAGASIEEIFQDQRIKLVSENHTGNEMRPLRCNYIFNSELNQYR